MSHVDLKKKKKKKPESDFNNRDTTVTVTVTVTQLPPSRSRLMCSHLRQLRSPSLMNCTEGRTYAAVQPPETWSVRRHRGRRCVGTVTVPPARWPSWRDMRPLSAFLHLGGWGCVHVCVCVGECAADPLSRWNRILWASTTGLQIVVSVVQLVMCLFHDASSPSLHSSEEKKKKKYNTIRYFLYIFLYIISATNAPT